MYRTRRDDTEPNAVQAHLRSAEGEVRGERYADDPVRKYQDRRRHRLVSRTDDDARDRHLHAIRHDEDAQHWDQFVESRDDVLIGCVRRKERVSVHVK